MSRSWAPATALIFLWTASWTAIPWPEASWMSMPVLSWQGVVFGDPLYRPYARMKDMDVKPTEEDRYFQGWWASSVQFGDRWKDRSARLMESARKAPFSAFMKLWRWSLYRKEPVRAGELLSSALDGAADAAPARACCWKS